MTWWQALILGLAQGLTEFLPVSSSGHLTLLQRVMRTNVGEAELFFDIILHLGTLVAVCFIFYKDIFALFKRPYKTLGYLLAASLPAAIVGFALGDIIDGAILGGSLTGIFLAIFFLITAILLAATEIYAKRKRGVLPLSMRQAIPMGLMQAVAIVPGISRSGATIAAGVFSGGRTEEVAHFSFLMSIPVIFGSFIVELIKGLARGGNQGFSASFAQAGGQFGWCIAIGFIVSALSGLAAIKVMVAAIKRADYKWFSVYLTALSAVCLILYFTGII